MTIRLFALTAGTLVLAAACVAPEDRATYRAGAYIDESAGLKAFADAVIAHCAPAVEGQQDFSDFEMKGATPIRAIADNKIPVVSGGDLPVWQLAEGVVQMQLDPYSACEVVAVGLPSETAITVGQGTVIELSGPEQGQTPDGRTYTKVTANVSQGAG